MMLLASLALAAAMQSAPAAASSAPARSQVVESGGMRIVDLKRGDRIVLTFDDQLRPTLQSVSDAHPIPIPAAGTHMTGNDPHPLNHAAPGTVVMNFAADGQNTQLHIENGLDRPIRFHGVIFLNRPDGTVVAKRTTLCPAFPKIGDSENWQQPIE